MILRSKDANLAPQGSARDAGHGGRLLTREAASRHVYQGDALQPPETPATVPTRCPIHPVEAVVCGGPHREVLTDLGKEVLGPNEEPQGTPKEE